MTFLQIYTKHQNGKLGSFHIEYRVRVTVSATTSTAAIIKVYTEAAEAQGSVFLISFVVMLRRDGAKCKIYWDAWTPQLPNPRALKQINSRVDVSDAQEGSG